MLLFLLPQFKYFNVSLGEKLKYTSLVFVTLKLIKMEVYYLTPQLTNLIPRQYLNKTYKT